MTEPTWDDEGLYFTLALNFTAIVALIIAAYILHTRSGNFRVLRPNRPGSSNARFFFPSQGSLDLRSNKDEEVGLGLGISAQIHVLFLKHSTILFFMAFFVAVILVPTCATDDYLNTLNIKNDPEKCRSIQINSTCTDVEGSDAKGLYCKWVGFQLNKTTGLVVNGSSPCVPKLRRGLFQFSVQNLTPADVDGNASWRLWIYGICVFLFSLAFLIAMLNFSKGLEQAIRDSFITGPIDPLTNQPIKGSLFSIGARTVLIQGLDPKREKRYFASAEVFFRSFIQRHPLPAESVGDAEKSGIATFVPIDTSAVAGVASKAVPSSVKGLMPTDPSPPPFSRYSQYAIPESVAIIRKEPKNALKLIEQEEQVLEDMKDHMAQTKAETDPEKLPISKGFLCLKKEDALAHDRETLDKIRKDLRPALDAVPNEDHIGVVFIAFQRPNHAYSFVEEYNDAMDGVNGSRASIAGCKKQIVWRNLPVSSSVALSRWALMLAAFVGLTFCWGIPVAFLGSLDKLATVPGIGPAFRTLSSSLSETIRGILSAYLPTIVIAGFNIALPFIIRLFALVGGVRTGQALNNTVLVLYFVFTLMSGLVIQAGIQGGLGQLSGMVANPSRESVFALILAVCSPSGGYFFAFITCAGCLATYFRLLDIPPLIKSKILVKFAKRQKAYDALFAPREWDYAILGAKHLFFFSIGILFHATVPFIVPFALIYFLNNFMVDRSLLLDSGARDPSMVTDLTNVVSATNVMMVLHLVAVIGSILVASLKLSWGAMGFCIAAALVNVFGQIQIRRRLRKVVHPTSRWIAAVEADAEAHLEEENSTQASATTMKRLFRFHKKRDPYFPSYATHQIDEDAVSRIEAANYTIDTDWPRQLDVLRREEAERNHVNEENDDDYVQSVRAHPAALAMEDSDLVGADRSRMRRVNLLDSLLEHDLTVNRNSAPVAPPNPLPSSRPASERSSGLSAPLLDRQPGGAGGLVFAQNDEDDAPYHEQL